MIAVVSACRDRFFLKGHIVPKPLKCLDAACGAYPTPDVIECRGFQGYPWVFGQPIGCNINWNYTDLVIPVCDGTYKIAREWTIVDWCLGQTVHHTQIIKVLDESGKPQTAKILSISDMRKRIIKSISIDTFIKYQNGNLVTDFHEPTKKIDIKKYSNTKLYSKLKITEGSPDIAYFTKVVSAFEKSALNSKTPVITRIVLVRLTKLGGIWVDASAT